ncbi:hypothetical protein [Photorhabdus australis]|uniref:hypothetical protein n=1 Tax=Photorhabdus australis TaxID=286156 RepID=UPI0009438BF0
MLLGLGDITPYSAYYRRAIEKIMTIPVIFQVASLLAAFTYPSHIVIYAPGDALLCRRDSS